MDYPREGNGVVYGDGPRKDFLVVERVKDAHISQMFFDSILFNQDLLVECLCGLAVRIGRKERKNKCSCGATAEKVVYVQSDEVLLVVHAVQSGVFILDTDPVRKVD